MYYFEKVATWNTKIRSCNHFSVSEFIRWSNHLSDLNMLTAIFFIYLKILLLFIAYYFGVKIKIVTDKKLFEINISCKIVSFKFKL